MRTLKLVILFQLIIVGASAQLYVSPGAIFYAEGNGSITLHNMTLLNSGYLNVSESTIWFTGGSSSSIGGNSGILLKTVIMQKTNGSLVSLQRNVNILDRIVFNGGFVNLNGYDLILDSGAILDAEKETSHVVGGGGGFVIISKTLNNPVFSQPGSLGLYFTSPANLGLVTIRRGHQSQTNGIGMGSSILRHYEILTAAQGDVNATLRIQYLDAQVNGLDENTLVMYENNGSGWSPIGISARNTASNFVERNGISTLRKFTLSSQNNALPVQFRLVNIRCESNQPVIYWTTAQEQNSSHFEIQKSTDGAVWTKTGTVKAAGNSSVEQSYSFPDNNSSGNNLYRIAAVDLDGKTRYSGVIRSACTKVDVFRLWPNPTTRVVYVNIVAQSTSDAVIKVFDNKGSLKKQVPANVLQGNNQLTVDLSNLPAGVYHISAEWNKGEMKQTVPVIKQ